MTVVERVLDDGRKVFSARAIVPLAVLPVVVLALPESWRVEERLSFTGNAAVQWAALAIALAGMALRCSTVAFAPDGTSSRDTRGLRAPSLNTTGVYSLVRHPLYLGSGLMWLGVAASLRVWWLVLIVSMVYGLYVERLMIFEEAFLDEQFGEAFRRWSKHTPAIVPKFTGWIAPTASFQWRRVLSEHNGLLAIAIAFPFLQFLEDINAGESVDQWYGDHRDLLVLLAVAVVVSLISIVLRRFPIIDRAALHPRSAQRRS